MRFKGLDLNLLVAFDALVETRSVSRAAERLNLSQPAMSAALRRLRDYFGDPLLVPHGKRMHPTAFAENLWPGVRACLHDVDQLVASSNRFDPLTSHRAFRVVASDYVTAAVMVPLVARLSAAAPHVRLELTLPGDQSIEQIGQGSIDLLITPEDYISANHPAELLFEENHVVVGWSGNPIFAGGITEQAFLDAGYVAVEMGNNRTLSFADRQLEQLGKQRRVEIVASSFTVIPWLVQDTMRVAIMHERLAVAMAKHFPLVLAPMPFPFPAMRQMVQYHQARSSDDGLSWLRGQLRDLVSGDQ